MGAPPFPRKNRSPRSGAGSGKSTADGSQKEAEAALKYVKTKFARALLGVFKTTQDLTPSKWECIPLQDFSEMSDIRWNTPVYEIDGQLYRKYSLSEDEIRFIETNVQGMK